jgi:predicted nucleotidyltransferase
MELYMVPETVDDKTRQLIADLLETGHRWNAQRILAVILYRSVARHEERPLDDPEPSDVDLLFVFDTDTPFAPYDWHMSAILEDAYRRHLEAPREVNIMFATRNLAEWDETFIANVARDGMVLYGERPHALQRAIADAVAPTAIAG